MNRLQARTRRLAIALLGATLFTASAHALQPLIESPDDYRIKTVPYSKTDLVKIDAVVGLQTHIWLSEEEEYVTHAFGDPNAWELAEHGNHIFIKPRAADGDTNLTLITTKRVYNILLEYIGDWESTDEHGNTVRNNIQTPWSLRRATVQLRYTYPEEEHAREMAAAEAEREQQRIADALSGNYGEGEVNLAYIMSNDRGSESIAPMNIWDDYRFTYFKFPPAAELPTIWAVGPDGQEARVNVHPQGANSNILVAQQVAQTWYIRSGQRVIGVINNGYDPTKHNEFTGTSSGQVRRVIRNRETGQ